MSFCSSHYSSLVAISYYSSLVAISYYSSLVAISHYSSLVAISHYSSLVAISHYSSLVAISHYSSLEAMSYYSSLVVMFHCSSSVTMCGLVYLKIVVSNPRSLVIQSNKIDGQSFLTLDSELCSFLSKVWNSFKVTNVIDYVPKKIGGWNIFTILPNQY